MFRIKCGILLILFGAGYVETWGRGLEKICEACKQHGAPMPEYFTGRTAKSFDLERHKDILFWDFSTDASETVKSK